MNKIVKLLPLFTMSVLLLSIAFTLSCSDDKDDPVVAVFACHEPDNEFNGDYCWEAYGNVSSGDLNSMEEECREYGSIMTSKKCPEGAKLTCPFNDGSVEHKIYFYSYKFANCNAYFEDD